MTVLAVVVVVVATSGGGVGAIELGKEPEIFGVIGLGGAATIGFGGGTTTIGAGVGVGAVTGGAVAATIGTEGIIGVGTSGADVATVVSDSCSSTGGAAGGEIFVDSITCFLAAALSIALGGPGLLRSFAGGRGPDGTTGPD
jgi:hypothetical protein